MALKDIEVEADGQVLIKIPHKEMRLLVRIKNDRVDVISDKCRHRGGPIHLCYSDGDDIPRCPWHNRKILREDMSEEICATYYRNRKILRLISQYAEDVIWPTSVIVPPAGEVA